MQLMALDRQNFARLADGLAVALVVSLPWSTSATGILAVLWLLALILTLDLSLLRRLIVACWRTSRAVVMLGVIGMLWADVPWAERFGGATSFFKLFVHTAVLHQFFRSDAGRNVPIGFLCSCVLLLVVSWLLLAWPWLPWLGTAKSPGVPVKDYISQSGMFTVCIVVIVQLARLLARWPPSIGNGAGRACGDFSGVCFTSRRAEPPLSSFRSFWGCSATGYSAGKELSALSSDVLY